VNAQKCVSCTHGWHSYERRLLGVPTNTFLIKTVSDALIKYNTLHGIPGPAAVDVVGYTTADIRGQCYRSNPYWKGGESYDWACVRFSSTVAPYSKGGDTCICRIMGFITYSTPGALTYGNM
jgi:hypothetical protein